MHQQPTLSLPGTNNKKLPRSLEKLKRSKDRKQKRNRICIYGYCAAGSLSTLGAFVVAVYFNKEPFFRHPFFIMLYLSIILLTFALFSFLCFQGLKEFRNAFSILRMKLIASYLISFVALVDLILRVTDSSLRFVFFVIVPHLFAFSSTLFLNVLICRSHKGTIFKRNPEADVDKVEFGSTIMKDIGKLRGDSILKNVKHSKLAEETEAHSCVICCLPLDNKEDRAFELAKCQHTFHHTCLKEWIKRMNTSCPICRDQYFQQKE